MKKALMAIAVCGTIQPALAQWGVIGFTEDGRVYEIDEYTGDMALVGDIGMTVIDAAGHYLYYGSPEVVVLTEQDRYVSVNLRNFETTFLGELTGRPSGYVPVAYSGDYAVLRTPGGDDILYWIDRNGVYIEMGPTGLNDVTGMSSERVCTASGGLYTFDSFGETTLVWSVNNGDPINAVIESRCRTIVSGIGLYRVGFLGIHSWPVRPSGFEEISALTFSDPYSYACTMDTGAGISVCDIFDFLQFQNYFVQGNSIACDCDTSTGSGLCDVFDFLCFQNAWVQAATRCR